MIDTFDISFRATNARSEGEIEKKAKYDAKLAEIIDTGAPRLFSIY
jgi:hypothetical protein